MTVEHGLTQAAVDYKEKEEERATKQWVSTNRLYISEASRKAGVAFPGVGASSHVDPATGPNNLHSFLFQSRRRACWTPSFLWGKLGQEPTSQRNQNPDEGIENAEYSLSWIAGPNSPMLTNVATPRHGVNVLSFNDQIAELEQEKPRLKRDAVNSTPRNHDGNDSSISDAGHFETPVFITETREAWKTRPDSANILPPYMLARERGKYRIVNRAQTARSLGTESGQPRSGSYEQLRHGQRSQTHAGDEGSWMSQRQQLKSAPGSLMWNGGARPGTQGSSRETSRPRQVPALQLNNPLSKRQQPASSGSQTERSQRPSTSGSASGSLTQRNGVSLASRPGTSGGSRPWTSGGSSASSAGWREGRRAVQMPKNPPPKIALSPGYPPRPSYISSPKNVDFSIVVNPVTHNTTGPTHAQIMRSPRAKEAYSRSERALEALETMQALLSPSSRQ